MVLVLGAVLVGCGDDGTDTSAKPTDRPSESQESGSVTSTPESDYASVCVARDAAVAGDIDTARTSFDHGPLHELADAALDVDRAVAAQLLEAKEAVESDLADQTTPAGQVADDLEALVRMTTAALVATGAPTPDFCGQENP
jgi:hypothetical protein